MNNLLNRLAPAVVLGLPLLAIAQQSSDPTDDKAAAQVRYQSAFADYKPWQDIKPGDWRQLNDNVRPTFGAAGGHAGQGIATPAASESASAPSPTPKASAPAMPAHEDHQMHGGKR